MMILINYIYILMKKIIIAFVMLYTLNTLIGNINLFVPINLFTIVVTSFFGIPGIISLTYISFFIK